VVVGAGMVGLSTAWFLQERGVQVTVIDREGVAAGSSWGNAGWLSPGLAAPLPEPSVLRYGLKALFDPSAALYVPFKFDPTLWGFLARFAMNCTSRQWKKAMDSYLEINALALDAFDHLGREGVPAATISAPIMASFEHADQAQDLRHEFSLLHQAGQHLHVTELNGDDARMIAPQLSERIELVLQLHGQRYLDPGAFVNSLADSVVARGAVLRTGEGVRALAQDANGVTVATANGDALRADAAVVATGAWLGDLASRFGVRMRVQAGRGYSFSVATSEPVPSPLYFPVTRVACTPYRGGLRVGGTMEFRSREAPVSDKRVEALVKGAKPVLRGVDWDSIADVWVGSRPVTADGLPLVGATSSSRIFVAGGHGMWGMTLGPVTGKLLAEQIVTSHQPTGLRAFSPLR
jgi:D-amino-acid dehydrogenase